MFELKFLGADLREGIYLEDLGVAPLVSLDAFFRLVFIILVAVQPAILRPHLRSRSEYRCVLGNEW